jgi:hypothetical protein
MELLKFLSSEKSPLSRKEVSKILAIRAKTGTALKLALDLRDSSIFWVNDLEKDAPRPFPCRGASSRRTVGMT